NPAEVLAECQAGLVPVRVQEDLLSFQSPALLRSEALDAAQVRQISELLGIDSAEIAAAFWADNGPGWRTVLLDSADAVLALAPDASRHPGVWKIGVLGPLA